MYLYKMTQVLFESYAYNVFYLSHEGILAQSEEVSVLILKTEFSLLCIVLS